jgi:hypothetical protein
MSDADTEKSLEQRLKDAKCDAPRLTPEKVDSVIMDAQYVMYPSGKGMACELVLANGYTVRGESCVVDRKNFREDIGREIAFADAKKKVWGLEAYLLQQRLADAEKDMGNGQ